LADVWNSVQFLQGDIRDPALLDHVVQGRDVVFNCAAQTSHTLSFKDPLYDAEVNGAACLRLLETVRERNPAAVVVYPSSSTVIGRATGDLIDERHSERPLDLYSAHKSIAEKYHYIYAHVHGLKTVILRFPNLYGPCGRTTPDYGFVNYFISLASEGKQITVYGAGDQRRNLLFVDDAVDVMYKSAFDERLYGDIFFVAHDEHLSVIEIAERIVAEFGRSTVVSVEWPETRRRIEVDSVALTSEKFRAVTGWSPTFGIDQGLRRTRQIMERGQSAE
jgi:UDP-glucose 4-epimerase